MSSVIRLGSFGYALWEGRLYNHDYLWFSSTEIAKVSSSWPVIHNYALSYALSQYSYGLFRGNTPCYEDDLAEMAVYATPAVNPSASRTTITLNAVDDLTLRTDTGGKVNTPNLGKRVVIDPRFGGWQDARSEDGYKFYCFVRGEYKLPGVVRLGKKGCPVRVHWQAVDSPKAFFREDAIVPVHPINPLDVSGEIVWYEPIVIPPHLVFRRAEIRGDWFVKVKGKMVLLPRRLRERWDATA